jgi:hypothetical protein
MNRGARRCVRASGDGPVTGSVRIPGAQPGARRIDNGVFTSLPSASPEVLVSSAAW